MFDVKKLREAVNAEIEASNNYGSIRKAAISVVLDCIEAVAGNMQMGTVSDPVSVEAENHIDLESLRNELKFMHDEVGVRLVDLAHDSGVNAKAISAFKQGKGLSQERAMLLHKAFKRISY
jgi:hypothetical protein